MSKKGTITFQVDDKEDIFLIVDLWPDGSLQLEENGTLITEPGGDESKDFISGRVPKKHPVNISGDATLIRAWLKTDDPSDIPLIKIIIEYEEEEEQP